MRMLGYLLIVATSASPAVAASWHCTVPDLRSAGHPLEALYTSWSHVLTVCHGGKCSVVRLSEAYQTGDGFMLIAQRREESWSLQRDVMLLSATMIWPKEVGSEPTEAFPVVFEGECEVSD